MPLHTVVPDKCFVNKLDDPHHMQNYVSQILTMPKVTTKGDVEEIFKNPDSVSMTSELNTQMVSRFGTSSPAKDVSNGSLCKGDSDYHAKKASQACIEYRKKMHKTLSMLNDNMSNMLRESFTGIDSICHRVRNCIYELEHQNAVLRTKMYSNALHDEAEKEFTVETALGNENEARGDIGYGREQEIDVKKEETIGEDSCDIGEFRTYGISGGEFTHSEESLETEMISDDENETVVTVRVCPPKNMPLNGGVASPQEVQTEAHECHGKTEDKFSSTTEDDESEDNNENYNPHFKNLSSNNSTFKPKSFLESRDDYQKLSKEAEGIQMKRSASSILKNSENPSENEILLIQNLKELRENISKIKTLNSLQKMRNTFETLEKNAEKIKKQKLARKAAKMKHLEAEVTKDVKSLQTGIHNTEFAPVVVEEERGKTNNEKALGQQVKENSFSWTSIDDEPCLEVSAKKLLDERILVLSVNCSVESEAIGVSIEPNEIKIDSGKDRRRSEDLGTGDKIEQPSRDTAYKNNENNENPFVYTSDTDISSCDISQESKVQSPPESGIFYSSTESEENPPDKPDVDPIEISKGIDGTVKASDFKLIEKTAVHKSAINASESVISIGKVFSAILEMSGSLLHDSNRIDCLETVIANSKNISVHQNNKIGSGDLMNQENQKSKKNKPSDEGSIRKTEETNLSKGLYQNFKKFQLKNNSNKETSRRVKLSDIESFSSGSNEKIKRKKSVKLPRKIKNVNRTDTFLKKKKNTTNKSTKKKNNIKNDSSSYSDYFSNESDCSESWESSEATGKEEEDEEESVQRLNKRNWNNLGNEFHNKYKNVSPFYDEAVAKDIREVAHILEKIDEEIFYNSTCDIVDLDKDEEHNSKEYTAVPEKLDENDGPKLESSQKEVTKELVQFGNLNCNPCEVKKKIEILKAKPEKEDTFDGFSTDDVDRDFYNGDGKNGITIYQDFALGPREEAKIQCVMNFNIRKLTDRIHIVLEDESDDEEMVEITLTDKELFPPDVYRKRAFVDIHQKLVQQIDASDSLLGFLKLVERKKYYINNDDEDQLKTVALNFSNIADDKPRHDSVPITESSDEIEIESAAKKKDDKKKPTKTPKKQLRKQGSKKIMNDVKSPSVKTVGLSPYKVHLRTASRTQDLAKKYVDSLYFSPNYMRKRRMSKMKSPKQTFSKEIRMSDGPSALKKVTKFGNKSRSNTPKSIRSSDSCSSRCSCRLLVQNASPSFTSTSSKCRIHWMRAKIQQTARNRRKYLNFCDILDDVTPRDLTPFKSEYPRRDCLIPQPRESFRKVQDTYLYNLLYGKNVVKNAWDNLITSKKSSLMKSLSKSSNKAKESISKLTNFKKKKSTSSVNSLNTSPRNNGFLQAAKQLNVHDKPKEVAEHSLMPYTTDLRPDDEEWIIEKLMPYMNDPQPHYFRSMTILPVKVFYDNFPSLREVQNLDELYDQDLQTYGDHGVTDMNGVGIPASVRQIMRPENNDSDSKSETPVTPLPPRVIITDPTARIEAPQRQIEQYTPKKSPTNRAKGDSRKYPKTCPHKKTPPTTPVTQVQLNARKKPLTDNEKKIWSSKFGKSTGQRLVDFVSRQAPDRVVQPLTVAQNRPGFLGYQNRANVNAVCNINKQQTVARRKVFRDTPRKMVERKAKSVERPLGAAPKKNLASSVGTLQAKRQQIMLSQLQSLKARNTLIQDNIQKAIGVIESKMVDLLSSADGTNSIDAFNVMEQEITSVLKMMKTKSDDSAENSGPNQEQMVPEKDSAGSPAVEQIIPDSPSTEVIKEFQSNSPSARKLFQKLNNILVSDGSLAESDGKVERPSSRKRFRSKTSTQLSEEQRKKRKSISVHGTEVGFHKLIEDTSTSAEEKFIITVSREPPRRKPKRPKSREEKSEPPPLVEKTIPAVQKKISETDLPIVDVKKEAIKKEIVTSVVSNLQKIKETIDGDPELSVSDEFSVESSKGSCGDGMTAFEHEVDEVMAKVEDICTKLANDDLLSGTAIKPEEPTTTEEAVPEVKSDEFLTPFMSALKTLRQKSPERKSPRPSTTKSSCDHPSTDVAGSDLEMNPSYYSIINFLDTLSAMDEEKPLEVHMAREASAVLEEQIAEVVYPVDVPLDIVLTPVSLVDEKGDCKLATTDIDNTSASGDHSDINETIPEVPNKENIGEIVEQIRDLISPISSSLNLENKNDRDELKGNYGSPTVSKVQSGDSQNQIESQIKPNQKYSFHDTKSDDFFKPIKDVMGLFANDETSCTKFIEKYYQMEGGRTSDEEKSHGAASSSLKNYDKNIENKNDNFEEFNFERTMQKFVSGDDLGGKIKSTSDIYKNANKKSENIEEKISEKIKDVENDYDYSNSDSDRRQKKDKNKEKCEPSCSRSRRVDGGEQIDICSCIKCKNINFSDESESKDTQAITKASIIENIHPNSINSSQESSKMKTEISNRSVHGKSESSLNSNKLSAGNKHQIIFKIGCVRSETAEKDPQERKINTHKRIFQRNTPEKSNTSGNNNNNNNDQKVVEKIYTNKKCKDSDDDLEKVDEIIDGIIVNIRNSTNKDYVTEYHHDKLLKSFYTALFTIMFIALVFDYSC